MILSALLDRDEASPYLYRGVFLSSTGTRRFFPVKGRGALPDRAEGHPSSVTGKKRGSLVSRHEANPSLYTESCSPHYGTGASPSLYTGVTISLAWGDGDLTVTVAAGVVWQDVYKQAQDRGRFVLGGHCPSVGAAGGFSLGAGYGHSSRFYGTGHMTTHGTTYYTPHCGHLVFI